MTAERAEIIVLDPLMSEPEAAAILDLWRRFPGYGLYSNEGYPTTFAPELAQRYDAAVNFVRTGGRFGRKDADRGLMAARTNYFRETYAYGDEVLAPGIESFIRFKERSSVDFPQPDGPIIAVTRFA